MHSMYMVISKNNHLSYLNFSGYSLYRTL